MDGKVALSELGSSRAPGTEPQDLLVLRREDWGQIPGVSWLRWGPSVWGWCNSGAACRSSSLRAGLWDAPSCPGCSRSVLLPPACAALERGLFHRLRVRPAGISLPSLELFGSLCLTNTRSQGGCRGALQCGARWGWWQAPSRCSCPRVAQ